MNFKTDIPIYKPKEYLTRQLTMLFDPDMYDKIDDLSFDLGLSRNTVIRTLLNYGLKHCNIDADNVECCSQCAAYLPDEKDRFYCCNKKSNHFGSFRPATSTCKEFTRI